MGDLGVVRYNYSSSVHQGAGTSVNEHRVPRGNEQAGFGRSSGCRRERSLRRMVARVALATRVQANG